MTLCINYWNRDVFKLICDIRSLFDRTQPIYFFTALNIRISKVLTISLPAVYHVRKSFLLTHLTQKQWESLFTSQKFVFLNLIVSIEEWNWVFATNSDFLIFVSLQHNVAYHRYFKLCILMAQIIKVWNIICLHHQVAKK